MTLADWKNFWEIGQEFQLKSCLKTKRYRVLLSKSVLAVSGGMGSGIFVSKVYYL